MSKYFRSIIIILFLLFILPVPGSAYDKGDEVIRDLVEEIATEVEDIRGLRFYESIDSELVTGEELKGYLVAELDKQITPEKEEAIELVYGQLGLIPTDRGFIETYMSMYEDQAGGIYDWRENRMLIVSSNLPGLSDEGETESGILSLLGVDTDLILRTVIAHELTHALEDQHFQFHKRFEEIQKISSSDREFALQCLVEGTATRLMIEHATGGVPLNPLQRSLNRILTSVMTDLSINLPLYYRRTLTSPYTLGEGFVSHLITKGGGWRVINAAYGDIPTSMEQIIHPDKYYINRDYPSDVQLADFAEIMGEGYEELLQDTLGEMVIGILLDIQLMREDFEEAPRGWDGDRLVGIQLPGGEVTIIWHSVWDTPIDAEEFADSLLNYTMSKLGEDAINHGKVGNHYKITDPYGREYIIGHEFDEVILIDNAPAGQGLALYTTALADDVIVRK